VTSDRRPALPRTHSGSRATSEVYGKKEREAGRENSKVESFSERHTRLTEGNIITNDVGEDDSLFALLKTRMYV
jgi:hypothetical protein